MKKINLQSPDGTSLNVRKLAALFPSVITESKGEDGKCRQTVDFDKLRQLLSGEIAAGNEKYEFTWVGKKAAIAEANKPTDKTLHPDVKDSPEWDTTKNIYIEGDNLCVLKLLQESYLKKIKLIYIDPPYNTGKDFIYSDNYQITDSDYELLKGTVDEDGQRWAKNTESNGRFHSDWCSMMYSRIYVARNLLSDDGILAISIDENEVDNMKKICNEVLGEKSFVAALHVQMSTVQGQKVKAAKMGNIVKNAEYILLYSKSGNKTIGVRPLLDSVKYDNHYNLYIQEESPGVFIERGLTELIQQDNSVVNELLTLELVSSPNKVSSSNLSKYYEFSPKFRQFIWDNANRIARAHDSIDLPDDVKESYEIGKVYTYVNSDRQYYVVKNNCGDVSQRILLQEKLGIADDFHKTYGPTTIRGDWWSGFYLDMGNVGKEGGVNYNNGKKPLRLIEQLIEFCSDGKEDIILDFFSGSATTAHAVINLNKKQNFNRSYILVQLPEDLDEALLTAEPNSKASIRKSISYLDKIKRPHTICELAKARIRNAEEENTSNYGFRVFSLIDSYKKNVYVSPSELTQGDLFAHTSNIAESASDLDLLFACVLDWGLPLHLKHMHETKDDCIIHSYDSDALVACFSNSVPMTVIDYIAQKKPLRVVFRDSSFADSQAKINVKERFKILSPDTTIKVI